MIWHLNFLFLVHSLTQVQYSDSAELLQSSCEFRSWGFSKGSSRVEMLNYGAMETLQLHSVNVHTC